MSSQYAFAQLGFCQGNSGDSIFIENFGTGLIDTSLPAGTTSYTYANGAEPDDGLYTVSSNTNYFDWFSIEDHTPNDINGRMLVVNSDFTAGEFYRTNISGLCENTSYEFSSWLINLSPAGGFCGSGAIPINVRFEIWDNTDTNLLASGSTGDIGSSNTPNWQQYALVFQTIPGQTSIILKMINNGDGGCGNDLAIDDIEFKSCGDFILVTSSDNNTFASLCSTQIPYATTLTATPDNAVFSNHFYQWQESPDQNTWTDIAGETNQTLTISATTTTYYRAKVAEFATNLNNNDCITFSTTFIVSINQAPDPPATECWETAIFDDDSCSWEVSGTQPDPPTGLECWEAAIFDNNSCNWQVSGTQPTQPTLECWETATFDTSTCAWEVTGIQPAEPVIECWETATFNNASCSWEVTGTQPTEPTGLECWEITTFNTLSCSWEITGTQPTQPNLACYETASFNSTDCVWEVTGIQPAQPTGLACWEVATFNDTLCAWEVTGTQPEPPLLECWESSSFNSVTCVWEITGIQPSQPVLECWETTSFNNDTCVWEITGTQPIEPTDLECWETASFNNDTCVWEITGTQPVVFEDEFLSLCEGESITLQANTEIPNATFQWDSGETTAFLNVDTAGTYIVISTDGCSSIEKTIVVQQINTPIISSVQSDGNDIIVIISNPGNFIYSLNGIDYQSSTIFFDVEGGKYTIYVKAIDCDEVITFEHLHFYIPKFFTPNNDRFNNTFNLSGIECFASWEVHIFNRYGKLLYTAKNRPIAWDGTFNNKPLPTSDYWYLINIEGQEFTGHFTLKR
ncbi:T9SS type B sorting domain-containing protein [uncultured Psychroserpens sp.]|uniref:T9SS type B sorting domain-containing protein n=1 Tax=uncultured Psychroserpens sp. TaxID=255436 RepID=UPI002602EF2A|nr:T9SS type B sorting domain-containing protein [uncultured Psychroserpens sp.]